PNNPQEVAHDMAVRYAQATRRPLPQYAARPVQAKGLVFPELRGVLQWTVLEVAIRPAPTAPVQVVPALLPPDAALDLARHAITLATQYAPADYASLSADQQKAKSEDLK